jgi:hypothetical protein
MVQAYIPAPSQSHQNNNGKHMASVFSSRSPLSVYKLDLDTANPAVFRINIDGNPFVAPITGFAVDLQGNYQFLHTVNDFIYLYVFGDRIGDLVLTGISFTDNDCPTTGGDLTTIFKFYKDNRVAVRNTPINITIGADSFLTFLTGTKIEQAKPDNGVVQWVMRFNTLMPT